MKALVTGGAGLIGSNFLNACQSGAIDLFSEIVVLDKLTYAGDEENIPPSSSRLTIKFERGDICNEKQVEAVVQGVDVVINFAAESHVDRSIQSTRPFVDSNILGTSVLLDISLKQKIPQFVQISTDEVYGAKIRGESVESDFLAPNSSYAASKASADLLCRAAFETHKLDVRITRCCNNYGPYQHPEKLIPKIITNLLLDKKIPLYGDGLQTREWIHAHEHSLAIAQVISKGKAGEIYNIAGSSRITNLELVRLFLRELNKDENMIEFVEDRKGHDRRYALNGEKARTEIGFESTRKIQEELPDLLQWYSQNANWWKSKIS